MKPHDLILGAHTSAAGGAPNALIEGRNIGASTIQLFSSNQKQWNGRTIQQSELDLWFKTLAETGIKKMMVHNSYLTNLGSPNEEVRVKSIKAFREEIERCLALKVTYLNFHPGAALKEDPQRCLDLIVENLLAYEPLVYGQDLTLCLEATAGQGSCVGHSFEQLGFLVDRLKDKLPIGVCIDTCHIFAAGYDVRTAEGWEEVLKEFDEKVGLKYLKAFHLNDSQKGLGSRVDRHAHLGEGEIGLDCFRFLVNDPRTNQLPMYLETPGGPERWKDEIILLKEMTKHA